MAVELIVKRGGEDRRVRVERKGNAYHVTVGEAAYRVDALGAGNGLRSLIIDGAQHQVSVHRRGEGAYWTSSLQGAAMVEVIDPLTHLAQEAHRAAGVAQREQVTAYMPGRVVAVLVEEGAEVGAGEGVVVLEAMKMENEIRTERDGVISRIFVEPGQAVEGGDPLFEIE